MNDLANTPRPPALQSLHVLLTRVLVDLAMRQPEPERSECLAILKKDGWL